MSRYAASSQPFTRRTQAQRRESTRQKLLDATIICLARDGYAGTTIGRVVAEAKVSHGASGHLFENKTAMLLAAADEAFSRFYWRWVAVAEQIRQSDDPLAMLLSATWQELLHGIENEVLLELLIIGKHDQDFNQHLQPLFDQFLQLVQQSAEQFFEAIQPDVDVPKMMMLTQWLFRGMALDRRINPASNFFQPYLEAWVALLRGQIQPRQPQP